MLKNLLLRNKIDSKKKALSNLREKDADFQKREEDLEVAVSEMDENTPEEDRKVIENQAEALDNEKEQHENDKKALESEIEKLEKELSELEERQKDASKIKDKNKNGGNAEMSQSRRKFFGMNSQERSAFFAREDVKTFIENVRAVATSAIHNKRGITGADLTIPDVILDLIKENIIEYSKLVNKVRLRPVSGVARQNVIEGLGIAIGIALDKAILYGVGTKMPQGIVTRLAQTSAPSNYPAKSRPWADLHTSNMITIDSGKTGLDFFKEIVKAIGNAKNKYSRGTKFWCMNEATYTKITLEAMNFNSAGAIVSIQDGVMPVVGGDIIVLSDDIIADNNIVAGYGDLYLLAERAGATFGRSDEYKFAEDLVAFKGIARYDGKPVIAEGFVAIGLGSAPASSAIFTGDKNNDASLNNITLGTETLSPVFATNKYSYTVTASGTKAIINAVPNQSEAKISILYNDKPVNNNSEITFVTGTKDMIITVKNGLSTLTYTISITKS